MLKIIRALIVAKEIGFTTVNYFGRVKDDYDLKIGGRRYSSAVINNFIEKDSTKEFGLFLRDENIGDIFDF